VKNVNAFSYVDTNRKASQRLFDGNYVNPSLLQFLMRLELTISNIVEKKNSSEGIRWFFIIMSSWDKIVEQYPPIQCSFQNLMNLLGDTFIAQNPQETMNLLTLMLGNTARIELLHKYFNPDICSNNWKGFFEIIYATKKNYGPLSILPLFRQFHTKIWLETRSPSTDERKGLLEHCMVVMLEYYQFEQAKQKRPQNEQEAEAEILAFYMDTFIDVVSFNFPELFLHGLQMIMNAVVYQQVSPMLVSKFSKLPFEKLGEPVFKAMHDQICDELWNLRRKTRVSLFDCAYQYSNPILDIIKNSFIQADTALLANVDMSFQGICLLVIT
jgi:hypothetical protein